MGEAWSVGSTLVALLTAIAAFVVPHRRARKADSEAAVLQARSAAGRASLVTASAPWSSSTTIDVVITNGAPAAIADVDLLRVNTAVEPQVTWRLNPNISNNTSTACILQPGESLTSRVQLLDAGGVPVSPERDMRLVITFGFRDTDGQWWKRDIGQPPQPCETRPVA